MKTTIDLPPELVRAMKLRAVHQGRKLKDVAADLLTRGLAAPEVSATPPPAKPRVDIQADGLPVVRCAADAPATQMTVDELLAMERESLEQQDFQRLGHAP